MRSFKVLTFNTFKLGAPVDPESVVEQVLDLEPDIVGFQEVFNTHNTIGFRSRNVRKILRRRLEGRVGNPGAGYGTFWHPSSGPGPFRFLTANKFQDGLMLAARAATWDASLDRDYASAALNDNLFTRRVVQGLVLRPQGEDTSIAVFNLHLTVGEEKRDEREIEIKRALEFVAQFEDRHQPSASILMGDFNGVIRQIGGPLLELRSPRARFIDTWKEANLDVEERFGNTIDIENTLIQARPPDRRRESMRIDFIFVSPELPVVPTASKVVLDERDPATGQNLSDHYGVLTEFEWR